MEIDYNNKDWETPCPKYDCKKAACKCGLEYVNIPASLGDDSEGSKVAPKNGAYCNALVFYEANGHVYIYTKEGVPTLIDVDASDISTLEQEVRKAQKDVYELREDIGDFIYGFDTVAQMKTAPNLSNGDKVKTLGYYAKNDGGDAFYYIREITAQDIIDEGKLIALNNQTLVAELIIENNVIDVKKFGAWADGVHDDSDIFQHCLDLVNMTASSTGTWKRTIVVPAVLRITKKIECEFGNFRMEGISHTNSKILLDSANAYLSFGKNSGETYEIEIQNITFQGNYSNTNPLLSFTKCVNLYLTRVCTENQGQDVYGIEFNQSGLIFMDKCTITGSNDLVNYPGNRNGIKVTQMGSIFNFTNANCWNLDHVFTFVGNVQNVNIDNNWIECYKSLINFDCAASAMSYMNVKIRNNTISSHHSENFTPSSISFVSYDMKATTNLYGSSLDISNNTIVFGNLTSINHDSLIYFNSIGGSTNSTFSIYFDRNVFSWQNLSTLNAYVFYNTDATFYSGTVIQIKSFNANSYIDASRITDDRKIVRCFLNDGGKGEVIFPTGIYLDKTYTNNYGNLYYANGEFYGGYAGSIKSLPKNVGTAISQANSGNVVDVVNDIRTALFQAHITTLG